MGGANPYIKPTKAELPKQPYTITYVLGEASERRMVQVDPARIPYDHEGLPGSLLEIALGNGVFIDHACGGVCACATCHVVVREGLESCNEPTEDEEDQLDMAPGLCATSRLACQCVPNGSREMVVEIPEWNRNLVQEGQS